MEEQKRTCPREGGEKIKQMDGGKPMKAEVVLEDADLVLPGLYLGSYKATEDKAKLKQQGITHILIAAANIQPKFPKVVSDTVLPCVPCPPVLTRRLVVQDFAYLVLHEVLDTEEQVTCIRASHHFEGIRSQPLNAGRTSCRTFQIALSSSIKLAIRTDVFLLFGAITFDSLRIVSGLTSLIHSMAGMSRSASVVTGKKSLRYGIKT